MNKLSHSMKFRLTDRKDCVGVITLMIDDNNFFATIRNLDGNNHIHESVVCDNKNIKIIDEDDSLYSSDMLFKKLEEDDLLYYSNIKKDKDMGRYISYLKKL